MISKNYLKYLNALQFKKFRQAESRFIVEGRKNLLELLGSKYETERLLVTKEFAEEFESLLSVGDLSVELASSEVLARAGTFKSNNAGLAVVKMRNHDTLEANDDLTLVLDDIRDPGNLGTIIRTADWFGFHTIVCSPTTADVHNPKVINATMGSFFRVNCVYKPLVPYLEQSDRPILGASLDGANIHQFAFPSPAILVIGNEAAGIEAELFKHINHKIKIPGSGGAESLNAAVATAIFCDNFSRNKSTRQNKPCL